MRMRYREPTRADSLPSIQGATTGREDFMAGRTRFVLRGVLIASMAAIAAGAQAVTLTVNSTADTVATDGACTLREAVANINAGSAVNADCTGPAPYGTGDAITFSSLATPATITLGSKLTLNKAVQILGQGDPASIVLDGANGGFSLITVPTAGTGHVDIYNIGFTRGGDSSGGGALFIESGRNVTIFNCAFTGNNDPSLKDGGAIWNVGTLAVGASRFTNNSVQAAGGAIMNSGSLTIDGSVFTGNQQTGLGTGGGAIHSATNSQLTVTNSSFVGNGAARSGGGAIFMSGASGTISGCTFSANTSAGSGGAAVLSSATGQTIGIQNSTFSGNQASPTDWGGAVYVNGGTIDFRNVTVIGNSALMGGGIFASGTGSVTHIRNSIVAGNSFVNGGSDPDFILWSGNSMVSEDYNLFGGCTACTLAAHDQTGVSPGLGALADNGGPTFGTPSFGPPLTHLPNPGSLATNGGNPSGCVALTGAALTIDQRGLTRPYTGTACDVGAVEVQAAAAVATKLAFAQQPSDAAAGVPIAPAVTVQLQDSGSNSVAQGGVSITLSLATGTGTLSGTLSQPTNASGLATFAGLSVNLVGTKTLSAAATSLTPAASISFVISAGLPAHIAITAGDGQSAMIGTAFGAPLQATVTDAFGQPVPGATVTFTPPGSGASALLAGNPATTNASGVASVTATANATAGTYQVTASVGTLPSVALTLTNLQAAPASVPALGGLGLLALSALLASAGVAFLTTRR